MAQLKNTTINDTGFLQLPSGTTAQRPGSAAAGQMRYNTTTNLVEWYDDEYGSWFPAGFIPPIATGGTVTDITQGGVDYRVHTFTTVGTSTFTVTRAGPVEFLIVAGGGAGGSGGCNAGASTAGGAGGLLIGSCTVKTDSYNVTVGAGANSVSSGNPPKNGENSSVLGFTTIGGGGGGVADSSCTSGSSIANGASGGSGGSGQCYSGPTYAGGAGTPGQGNAGAIGKSRSNLNAAYITGGGGGAGEPGEIIPDGSGTERPGGTGGAGVSSTISGTLTFYAGGGGGKTYQGSNGVAGLGNDIGGGGTAGGSGTKGLVIIRYRIS